MNQVRLFIADASFGDPSSNYWRDALRSVRGAGRIAIAGSAASAEEIPAQAGRLDADVLVVDLTAASPGTGAMIAAISAGMGEDADPLIVGLCDAVGEGELRLAVGFGARACVGRDEPQSLATAVVEVARGGAPIQRDLAGKPALLWSLALDLRRRLRGMYDPPASASARIRSGGRCPISAREVAILEMVADGCSYREIGESLTIAERTVKNHMARLLEKIGARGRAHAVRVALEAGWICNGPAREATGEAIRLGAAA